VSIFDPPAGNPLSSSAPAIPGGGIMAQGLGAAPGVLGAVGPSLTGGEETLTEIGRTYNVSAAMISRLAP
jgi:hypothetical protein